MTTTDVSRTAPPAPRADAVVAEVEAEREALSSLLHDAVAQSLFAARYAADLAGRPDVSDAIRAAIVEVTDAMWRLRPRTGDGDLVQALNDLAARHGDRVVAIRAEALPKLSLAAATVAYRVCQAAVAESAAATFDIRAEVRSGVLTVSVSDDGPPYDGAVYAPDSELARWLGRAGSLGGSARVGDSMTGGTTLWLEIPNALPEGDDVP
jgi:signal transduction histidine kinase